MKHLNYILLGAAGLMLASCSQDDLKVGIDNGDGTANVTLTLSMPQMQTRTFSDGKTAKQLVYAVYDKTSGSLNYLSDISSETKGKETIDIKKQMNFKLLTDHTYQFVFWAESADKSDTEKSNPYTVTFEDGKANLEVDYSNVNANDETLDAFYGGVELKITGDLTMEVPLYRPFAQINVGTNDYTDAKVLGREVSQSTMTVKGYSHMSLLDGSIPTTDNGADVIFQSADIPDNTKETFPVEEYEYLAMAYVLVPAEQETVTVKFDYTSTYNGTTEPSHLRTVGSVPVQRNHRTNIYGQILTSNAALNVEIKPIYDEPDYEPNPLVMAASIGGTLVLEEDIDLSAILEIRKDLIIDLNGHKIKTPNYGLRVWDGAHLTIKGDGEMESEGAMLFWALDGVITIESGTFIGNSLGEMIYIGNASPLYGGTVYIKGGKFQPIEGSGILNCQDKAYAEADAKFIVTGGSFYGGFNPADSAVDLIDGKHTNWLPKGYKSIESEIDGVKVFTVVPESVDAVVSDTESLNSVIKEAGEEAHIILFDGDYSLKDLDLKNAKSLTIEGLGDETKLSFLTTKNNLPCLQFGSLDLNLKNVTIKNDNNQNYNGFQVNTLVCENVTVDGVLFGYAYKGETYNNCKFVQNNASSYNVWTYTAYPMVFNDCEFHTIDGRGINLYNEAGDKIVVFNNCKFYSKNPSTGKAAIEIKVNSNADVTINNCTAEGFAEGSQSKNTLWNVPLDTYSKTLKLTVDGKEITIQK